MTRAEPRTCVAGAAKRAKLMTSNRRALHVVRRIGSGEPTIEIRGALVHLRCRRRLAGPRRAAQQLRLVQLSR